MLGNLRKSSDIFGNFRKFSGNVRERSSGLRYNLKNLRKSSENHQKRRHQYVYIINRIIHGRLEIWNLSSRVHIRYLTRSLRSLVRYRCEHSKINSISPRDHVLFSIYNSFDENEKTSLFRPGFSCSRNGGLIHGVLLYFKISLQGNLSYRKKIFNLCFQLEMTSRY